MNVTNEDVSPWISAARAIQLISFDVGGDTKAKRAIAERFFDMALEIRIDWYACGADIGDLPRRRPFPSQTKTGTKYAFLVSGDLSSKILDDSIGDIFRRLSTSRAGDIKRWLWGFGIFIFTEGSSNKDLYARFPLAAQHRIRHVVSGVRFRQDQIIRIATPLPNSPRSKIAKPKKEKWDWPLAVNELVEEMEKGTITRFGTGPDSYGTPTKLEKYIRDRVDPTGVLEFANCRHHARLVREAWRERIRDGKMPNSPKSLLSDT